MQQNNGMSRAAAMAYRVLIRRGVSALPVHPLEILSACRNTVVWADVSASALQRLSRVEELAVSPEILSAADDLLADWAQRVPLPPQRPGQHRLQIRTKFLPKA